MSTPYHSQYWAHALTLRGPGGDIDALSRSIANARVDLNPHQIDAAMFSLRSPLSNGAILADEVGLGKTIEAGIVLSQRWAERRRKIVIIVPAMLRKQWQQELDEKFFLPSVVLDSKVLNQLKRDGHVNPFDQSDRIVICSYHFAAASIAEIGFVPWDAVVIDEAHRMRNIHRSRTRLANNPAANKTMAHKIAEFLIFAARTDRGQVLDNEICRKLLTLPATVGVERSDAPDLAGIRDAEIQARLDGIEQRNGQLFDEEVLKLDRWSEDLKLSLEHEIKDLDKQIRELRRAAVLAQGLQDKLAHQKQVRDLERRRTTKRRELFDAQDAIDTQREDLITRIEKQLKQHTTVLPVYSIRWEID